LGLVDGVEKELGYFRLSELKPVKGELGLPIEWDTLLEGEEIMWNTLWNFNNLQWTEKNANITRKCGMIPVEVDSLIYVALGVCGMDLQAKLIYTQYKHTDWIESEDVIYLKHQ